MLEHARTSIYKGLMLCMYSFKRTEIETEIEIEIEIKLVQCRGLWTALTFTKDKKRSSVRSRLHTNGNLEQQKGSLGFKQSTIQAL